MYICIATWSNMPDFRILNPDSLILDPYQLTLWISKELFLICTWGESLKTLALSTKLVNNKPVLQSKLDTFSDKPQKLT